MRLWLTHACPTLCSLYPTSSLSLFTPFLFSPTVPYFPFRFCSHLFLPNFPLPSSPLALSLLITIPYIYSIFSTLLLPHIVFLLSLSIYFCLLSISPFLISRPTPFTCFPRLVFFILVSHLHSPSISSLVPVPRMMRIHLAV